MPTFGYRLVEPDGRRMLPDKLAALGITGPDIGRLQRDGRLTAGGRTVTVEQASERRPGQRFAFIMDTRLCDAAFALADRADLLVCESTFANAEAGLARDYGHLTAGQAGQIAAQSGARLLVLTHFSQRYESWDDKRLAAEAASAFGGEVVLARDLDRIPARRGPLLVGLFQAIGEVVDDQAQADAHHPHVFGQRDPLLGREGAVFLAHARRPGVQAEPPRVSRIRYADSGTVRIAYELRGALHWRRPWLVLIREWAWTVSAGNPCCGSCGVASGWCWWTTAA